MFPATSPAASTPKSTASTGCGISSSPPPSSLVSLKGTGFEPASTCEFTQEQVENIICSNTYLSVKRHKAYFVLKFFKCFQASSKISFFSPHSTPLPDMERGELRPLVQRLHSGSARHHCAPPTGHMDPRGLPAHSHWRHCGKKPGRALSGSVPNSQHRPTNPATALVQAHGRAHGHWRLPAIQVGLHFSISH